MIHASHVSWDVEWWGAGSGLVGAYTYTHISSASRFVFGCSVFWVSLLVHRCSGSSFFACLVKLSKYPLVLDRIMAGLGMPG
jgi:hypothetical protein